MKKKTPKEAILEALFWIEAADYGFIDGLGGSEWRARIKGGLISPEALAILRAVMPSLRLPS